MHTNILASGIPDQGRRTLSEQAYASIREDILTLKLKPGQFIYESELAEMLDMSRTPIREAIRILLTEELIEVLPQRGMKVALISRNKVEETRYVRELLEVGSIRKVVKNWNCEQAKYQRLLRDLEMNLELQKQAERERNYTEFLQADEMFHRLFMQSTGNTTLIWTVTQMRFHLNRVRILTLNEMQNTGSLTHEHEQLVAAVSSKEETHVVNLLTNHLRRLSADMEVIKNRYPSYFTES